MFKSSFEKLAAKLLQKAKVKFQYEPDRLEYTVTSFYKPDFKIRKNVYIETKGYFAPSDRRKLLAVKHSNPNVVIKIWFQRDNFLTKSKKKRYSDWAKENGFDYHVGDSFPKHWFDESKKM